MTGLGIEYECEVHGEKPVEFWKYSDQDGGAFVCTRCLAEQAKPVVVDRDYQIRRKGKKGKGN